MELFISQAKLVSVTDNFIWSTTQVLVKVDYSRSSGLNNKFVLTLLGQEGQPLRLVLEEGSLPSWQPVTPHASKKVHPTTGPLPTPLHPPKVFNTGVWDTNI